MAGNPNLTATPTPKCLHIDRLGSRHIWSPLRSLSHVFWAESIYDRHPRLINIQQFRMYYKSALFSFRVLAYSFLPIIYADCGDPG
jgi:hypothetical protein